jgi:ribosomal protein S21
MKVKVRNNNVESALRVLKRKMKEPLAELKSRAYYEKPCDARNAAKQAAKIRERKRQKNDRPE